MVLVSVLGYRRVNGYTGTGLRRVSHVFLEKTRCIRIYLPAASVPAYSPTREIQISKIFPLVHIKLIPVPVPAGKK
jgi:hypothetical protein